MPSPLVCCKVLLLIELTYVSHAQVFFMFFEVLQDPIVRALFKPCEVIRSMLAAITLPWISMVDCPFLRAKNL